MLEMGVGQTPRCFLWQWGKTPTHVVPDVALRRLSYQRVLLYVKYALLAGLESDFVFPNKYGKKLSKINMNQINQFSLKLVKLGHIKGAKFTTHNF